MMNSTKEIAKTSQEIVIKSSSDPADLGNLVSHISNSFTDLAGASCGAINNIENVDTSNMIKASVQDLGRATIDLVKASGSVQLSPNDSSVIQDLSDGARNVVDKCANVLSSLNASMQGTQAVANAANTVSGIIGDLDTTIMFASSGTLNSDTEHEVFAGNKLLNTAPKHPIIYVSQTIVKTSSKQRTPS